MKKIFCIISSRNNWILQISNALDSLPINYKMAFLDSYNEKNRFFTKLVSKSRKRDWYLHEIENIDLRISQYKPDILFIINPNIPSNIMEKWKLNMRVICWMVDSIVNNKNYEILQGCENFVYEPCSKEYLASKKIKARYCPVGYNGSYENTNNFSEKIFDVVFVGTLYKNRKKLLIKLAEEANKRNWKLVIYGPVFKKRYFWKKIIFKLKYPALYSCIKNGAVSPKTIASIYKQSKICLNIHDQRNKGVNPRTFEILATNSFELIDKREFYDILLPDKDIVVYDNIDNLIDKIDYYLHNEKIRENIASNGFYKVVNNRSLKNILYDILME